MKEQRYLIVNADDFGQSASVNTGIIEAHVKGIVTSTSMMTRWPAASEAAALARARPELGVGLHIDLGEWRLVRGEWAPVYEVVKLDDADAIEGEVRRQLDAFRSLLDREPTHLDSHQHVHSREPARSVIASFAARLDVPLRSVSSPARYVGDFYGQLDDGSQNLRAISVDGLIETLRRLADGVTELACHPGRNVELNTMYCAERDVEVDTLCDPRVPEAIRELEIALCSFERIGPKDADPIQDTQP